MGPRYKKHFQFYEKAITVACDRMSQGLVALNGLRMFDKGRQQSVSPSQLGRRLPVSIVELC